MVSGGVGVCGDGAGGRYVILLCFGGFERVEEVGADGGGGGLGSFAAGWQARYLGAVPKGSLFGYLQRLGMVWKKVGVMQVQEG